MQFSNFFVLFSVLFGCAGSTDINQLQKLRDRAARIITNGSFNTPKQTTNCGGGPGDH